MIGLVLLTHGRLATECLRAAEMIVGPIDACCAISIDRSCAVEDALSRLRQALADVGADNEGVLILTDMFGGTPTNIAAEFLADGQIDILTGLNLPMLLKAASARQHESLSGLAGFLCEYARQAILRPAELLKARSS